MVESHHHKPDPQTVAERVRETRWHPSETTEARPDGTVVPLATHQEYAAASYLPALNRKGQIVKDSLNYFPAGASIPCALQFFADLLDSSARIVPQPQTMVDRPMANRPSPGSDGAGSPGHSAEVLQPDRIKRGRLYCQDKRFPTDKGSGSE